MSFADYLGTGSPDVIQWGDPTKLSTTLATPPVQTPPPVEGTGFLDKVSGWLGKPENQLALAKFGKAISPQAIYGKEKFDTAGSRIADAFIPGMQGDVSLQKSQEAERGIVRGTGKKASQALGPIDLSALESEHVTGLTHKLPDGTTTTIKSPGPKDYADAQVIQNQIAAGQIPTGTSTPVSNALGNQSPFDTSQSVAGNSGAVINPANKPDVWNRTFPTEVMRGEGSNGADFKPDGTPVRSPKGALYAMQVMPSTAQNPGFGIRPAQDNSPQEYNRVGVEFYNALLNKYQDRAKALAAYNAGPNAVDQAIATHGENYLAALPQETQAYVPRALETGTPVGGAPMQFVQAKLGTVTDVPVRYQPPMRASEVLSGIRGAGGLSPEQINAAVATAIQAQHAPYNNALTAAQAANLESETATRQATLPTKMPKKLTLPGGQQVVVTGEDILKYQTALEHNDVLKQHYGFMLEQAKTSNELKEAMTGLRNAQEDEMKLKVAERKAKADLIKRKDEAGAKAPGSNLTYGEAATLGILDDLIRADQQNRMNVELVKSKKAHDAAILYKQLITDIQTPALARQAKMTPQQYIDSQMQAYGTDWRTLIGVSAQPGQQTTVDPLGIRKK